MTPTITQPELSRALGIPAEDLKKIRDAHLDPDADWQPGRPIRFTESGVAKICAVLAVPAPQIGADAPTGTSPLPEKKRAAAVRLALTVIRPAKGNPRIVLCRKADGAIVNLFVRANALFTPGMVLPVCAQRPNSPAVFDYEGRLPRRKGRL